MPVLFGNAYNGHSASLRALLRTRGLFPFVVGHVSARPLFGNAWTGTRFAPCPTTNKGLLVRSQACPFDLQIGTLPHLRVMPLTPLQGFESVAPKFALTDGPISCLVAARQEGFRSRGDVMESCGVRETPRAMDAGASPNPLPLCGGLADFRDGVPSSSTERSAGFRMVAWARQSSI